MVTPIPRPRVPMLSLLLDRHAEDWDIFGANGEWHAVPRSGRPGPPIVSAHTAAGLLADLKRIEEAIG